MESSAPLTGGVPDARRERLLAAAPIGPRPDGERTVLEKGLSHFLVDLSIALHRLAMYPAGHPSLAPALESLARDADALLQDRPRFAVGVARDRLVIEGVVTDDRHPLLRALAERLHRHRISALSFSRGLSFEELAGVVTAIAEDPDRGGRTLGEASDGEQTAWDHVRLHPLHVEDLEILDTGAGEGQGRLGRSISLWLSLARAAIGRTDEADAPSLATAPAVVAHAIDDHQRVEAYDQVIVGYLLQIAEEARDVRGTETLELRRRVSALVSALHPETLRRLLAMGGSGHQRLEFLHNAVAGLRAGAVVDLVKAAAQSADESVSNGLVRILTKLAAHAEAGTSAVRPLADGALRLQVERLLDDWQLPDSAPSDHVELLRRVAQGAAPARDRPRGDVGVEPTQIVQLCLALSEEGPALWRALDATVASTGLRELAALLEPTPGEGLAARVRAHLASAATVKRLLASEPPDFASVDLLLPHLAGDALGPLFDLLLESPDRRLRRAAFDRLRRSGAAGFAHAAARLGDGGESRWYAVRNLLALLAEIEGPTGPFDPSRWLDDSDPRVRREALRVAARDPGLHERAVCHALADADKRVVDAALAEAIARPTPAIVSGLRDVSRREPLDDDLRASAIGALARVAPDLSTMELLVTMASRAPRLLRGPGLAPKSRALLAALSVLATNWPAEPAAAAVLRRAARCGDSEIHAAAAGLGR